MTRENRKPGRNDPCPCGSGLKYKKCHLGAVLPNLDDNSRSHRELYGIRLKDPKDIEAIRDAGALVIETLRMVEPHVVPGISTDEINQLVHEFTIRRGGTPAPLQYRGFPKSVCVSVNETVCHGIPGRYVLREGDIVNVDVTTILNGYYADANMSFFAGTPGPDAMKIVKVARHALKLGMQAVAPGSTIGDIGYAIQSYSESEGCSVVRAYTGHGVGFDFHEEPQVPHYGIKGAGVPLVPGMVFTIEPMINLGRKEIRVLDDGWTAVTADGSLSAQFEQTIVVTDDGYESLTPYELDENEH